jgi:hypothetical protein
MIATPTRRTVLVLFVATFSVVDALHILDAPGSGSFQDWQVETAQHSRKKDEGGLERLVSSRPERTEERAQAERELGQTSSQLEFEGAPMEVDAVRSHGDAWRNLPWTFPGMCRGGMKPAMYAARAEYFAEFRWATSAHPHLVRFHPDVEEWILDGVVSQIGAAAESANSAFELDSTEPVIWIHPNVESLIKNSCASDVSVAYYDGAIHLAPDGDLSKTAQGTEPQINRAREHVLVELQTGLRHEYVHHVLITNGVGNPVWLQEGAATMIARDQPMDAYTLFKRHPVPTSQMIDGPKKSASVYEANVYYAQAYVMVDFLERLCLNRKSCGLGELAQALISGTTTPEGLFEWATEQRSQDLAPTAEVSVWSDYVKYGSFAPQTYQALLNRPPLPSFLAEEWKVE